VALSTHGERASAREPVVRMTVAIPTRERSDTLRYVNATCMGLAHEPFDILVDDVARLAEKLISACAPPPQTAPYTTYAKVCTRAARELRMHGWAAW